MLEMRQGKKEAFEMKIKIFQAVNCPGFDEAGLVVECSWNWIKGR
jgi:hypothetical protein